MGRANSEDNGRSITNTRAAVSGFRPNRVINFRNIGGGISGVKGLPLMSAEGIIGNAQIPPKLAISNYRNNASGVFIIGVNPIKVPYFGGTLIPNTNFVIPITGSGAPLVFDASALRNTTLPNIWVQALFLDPAATQGLSATDGFRIIL